MDITLSTTLTVLLKFSFKGCLANLISQSFRSLPLNREIQSESLGPAKAGLKKHPAANTKLAAKNRLELKKNMLPPGYPTNIGLYCFKARLEAVRVAPKKPKG
jgi:hypothetical protein